MQVQSPKTPITGDLILRPKSGRKPLQPVNFPATPTNDQPKTKPKKECGEVPLSSNKEKHPNLPTIAGEVQPFDASLAEELSAIKKKMERLRLDKEGTETMLRERNLALDTRMKELQEKGEVQKILEIEVDRLFRLKELKLRCMMVSPIKSLRQKQRERNFTPVRSLSQEVKKEAENEDEGREESVGENSLDSPDSKSCGSVTVK